MRPIDVIREKTDSDLMKYHTSTLCKIDKDDDVYNLSGVGVCALVRLLDGVGTNTQGVARTSNYFPVLIVNRMYGCIESNVSQKCYVMLLSSVADRTGAFSVGLLISQTAVTDIEDFCSQRLKQKATEEKASVASIDALKTEQETNHVRQKYT